MAGKREAAGRISTGRGRETRFSWDRGPPARMALFFTHYMKRAGRLGGGPLSSFHVLREKWEPGRIGMPTSQ